MFTYDDLYGVGIDEYCFRHGITIDDLIHKSEIDIEIMSKNLKRLLTTDPSNYLVDSIFFTIAKKRKHIQKLQEWKLASES